MRRVQMCHVPPHAQRLIGGGTGTLDGSALVAYPPTKAKRMTHKTTRNYGQCTQLYLVPPHAQWLIGGGTGTLDGGALVVYPPTKSKLMVQKRR